MYNLFSFWLHYVLCSMPFYQPYIYAKALLIGTFLRSTRVSCRRYIRQVLDELPRKYHQTLRPVPTINTKIMTMETRKDIYVVPNLISGRLCLRRKMAFRDLNQAQLWPHCQSSLPEAPSKNIGCFILLHLRTHHERNKSNAIKSKNKSKDKEDIIIFFLGEDELKYF